MTDDTASTGPRAPQNAGAAAPRKSDAAAGAAASAAAPAAAPSASDLSPAALAKVEEIKRTVDVRDPQMVIQFGLPAQNKLATFSDSLLADIRTKDTGEAGEALAELLTKVKELDVDSLAAGS
ncbi:MAG TPA: toxic anion resistance protein, partial [Thermoleophilia bacterium]|nr:toxic anion resistance protein [Thermoleophilia bacterium]